jgi:RNA polymerase sigma-70 factor (ECF subfamily)
MGTQNDLLVTRRSLLVRLKDLGDQRSWEDFFNTYFGLIYSVALKAGLADVEAQDVVQETIIAVAKKMPGFEYDPAKGKFKGWLLQITRRRIIDQFRRRMPAAQHQSHADSDGPRTATIERIPDEAALNLEAVWDEEWRKNLMQVALARVKQKVSASQYQIFDCYVHKQWTVEQVTSTLGVTANQVYLAKNRVTALLKDEVERLQKQQP